MTMKIMLINNCYPFKSTGKIIQALREFLIQKGQEASVSFAWEDNSYKDIANHIYKYGFLFEKYLFALLARVTGNQLGVAPLSTSRLIGQIKREKPDIVNIHCANAYSCNHYKLLNWLKQNHIPVVLTEHAEYFYTGNCSHANECEQWKTGCYKCPDKYRAVKSYIFDFTKKYWNKMRLALKDWKNNLYIVSVSPWQEKRSLQSEITKHHPHFYIGNGIDTQVFKPYDKNDICYSLKKPFILFVVPGVLTEAKGKDFIFTIAKKMPKYQFVIVGCSAPKQKFSNIFFIPHTDNPSKLAELYSAARVTLLLSKRETFSLVTAESLCCATPVVGFECGGAESIALTAFSRFVPYGNIELLIKVLKEWFDKPVDKILLRKEAVKKYNKEEMAQQYLNLFQELYSKNNYGS